MNQSDTERFDRIRRKIQFGATIKDLFWLVRLVEKLDRGGSLKKTVNLFWVEVADATSPTGTKFGVECQACGEQFFDRMSAGKNPRVLVSGIPVAIEHTKQAHQSTGGTVGQRKTSSAKSASAD